MSANVVTHRFGALIRFGAIALLVLTGAEIAVDHGLPTASAGEPVDVATYAISIQHRNVSAVVFDNGVTGVELELTLHNGGERELYDVRVFLDRVDAGPVIAHSPAILQTLAAGKTAVLTWTFEGLLAPPTPAMLARLDLRLEAVDTSTEEIVMFTVASRED